MRSVLFFVFNFHAWKLSMSNTELIIIDSIERKKKIDVDIVLEHILYAFCVILCQKEESSFPILVLIINNKLLNVDATANSSRCHSPNAWAFRIDFQAWMIRNYLLCPFLISMHGNDQCQTLNY